ncbi:uncharacterized protein [Panulirus ornatus]|uniref:uncharacterized protein isoform X2 n=1 Tax=Panulirus ornatus TaxID=150431 RepID=UPI003A841D9C
MKADHRHTILLLLICVTVKRPVGVTAENSSVSHVRNDEDTGPVHHLGTNRDFYESLALEGFDDAVTLDVRIERTSGHTALPEDMDTLRSTMASPPENKEENALPVVSKGGVLYYDIAQVKATELVIRMTNVKVGRITATRDYGPCLVESLVLKSGFIVDKDIALVCNLKNLTLKGREWQCTRDWSWLRGLGAAVDYRRATCTDAFCHREYYLPGVSLPCYFEEVLKKDLPLCPDVCSRCLWHFRENDLKVTYTCDNASLTDSMLPELPENLTSLSLEGNKIRSTERLFERLENTRNLEVLNLGRNELVDFPYLDRDIFNNLIDLSLNDNQLKELRLEAIQPFLAKEELIMELQGNPWRCDCNAYTFYESLPLWFIEGDGCMVEPLAVDIWAIANVVLAILNCIMIYIIVDLTLIITNFRGWKNTKRPKLDYAVCWAKAKLNLTISWFRRTKQDATAEEEEGQSRVDREVTIRSHNRSSIYRMRTPVPPMD